MSTTISAQLEVLMKRLQIDFGPTQLQQEATILLTGLDEKAPFILSQDV